MRHRKRVPLQILSKYIYIYIYVYVHGSRWRLLKVGVAKTIGPPNIGFPLQNDQLRMFEPLEKAKIWSHGQSCLFQEGVPKRIKLNININININYLSIYLYTTAIIISMLLYMPSHHRSQVSLLSTDAQRPTPNAQRGRFPC